MESDWLLVDTVDSIGPQMFCELGRQERCNTNHIWLCNHKSILGIEFLNLVPDRFGYLNRVASRQLEVKQHQLDRLNLTSLFYCLVNVDFKLEHFKGPFHQVLAVEVKVGVVFQVDLSKLVLKNFHADRLVLCHQNLGSVDHMASLVEIDGQVTVV